MTAERRPVAAQEPCRCALCLALLDAAARAERLQVDRRSTMRLVDGGKR